MKLTRRNLFKGLAAVAAANPGVAKAKKPPVKKWHPPTLKRPRPRRNEDGEIIVAGVRGLDPRLIWRPDGYFVKS